ncbi:MAG: substrate-binding domain-containing protein, partial [Actinomycetia bacterium]|nr:substrate-binding domain-containing protein [Actinomycetes bacterium]
VPLVVLGEQSPARSFDHVGVDNVAAARSATEHLLGLGRRGIATIGAQPHLANSTADQRTAGFRLAVEAAGLPPDDTYAADVRTLHRNDGAEAMRRLLDESPDIGSVFCFTDELALGAIRAAYERGLHVPDDLAIVGFDDIEDGRFSIPSLTTIAPDKALVATRAVELLEDRLRDPSAQSRREVTPYQLIERESTGVTERP